MAKTFQVQPLEEACFSYILGALDDYPDDILALLPAEFRRRMLFNLPVVDICRLEQSTKFVSGLDMDKVWEHVSKAFSDRNVYTPGPAKGKKWREHLLDRVCTTLLQDGRPYGYFRWTSRADKSCPWVCNEMVEDHPVEKHPTDIVNCLVAVIMEGEQKTSGAANDSEGRDEYYRRKYGPCCVGMTRHEVTLHKGIVPPSPMYSEALKLSLSVPQRYRHLFTQDGNFLPDSTAIALLAKKCSYYPKKFSVNCAEFNTFLENFEHETSDVSLLVDFLKYVESLAIVGEMDKQLAWIAYPKAKNKKPTQAVPSKVLKLITLNPHPVLSSLRISISKHDDTIVEAIEPILSTSFGSLKSLALEARGKVSPDIQKLIAITSNQTQLQNVNISIHEVEQIFGSFGPIVKSTPDLSFPILLSWVELCLKLPTLSCLKFSVSPITGTFLQQVALMFLSTPCSSDQTLDLSINRDKETALPSTCPVHVDDACTLRYKSLTLNSLSQPFATWLFNFQQVKLKKLTISDYHVPDSSVVYQLAQGSLDFESLVIHSVSFRKVTTDDYKSLFHKPSLKSLNLEGCSQIDFSHFAAGLKEQVKTGALVNLSISYSMYSNKQKELRKDDGLIQLFSTVFSLPQLPKFSLSLMVTLTGIEVKHILSTWELVCKVPMKSLSVIVVESDKTTSLVSGLSRIAESVNIVTVDKKKVIPPPAPPPF